MALKNAALVGVSQVNFRNVQYPVSPGGLLIGLPADVEEGLLKVGFERVPDPVAKPATAPGAPAAKTPGRTNGLTPDEIRAAIKESVESIRPRNYEEAQTIARRKLKLSEFLAEQDPQRVRALLIRTAVGLSPVS